MLAQVALSPPSCQHRCVGKAVKTNCKKMLIPPCEVGMVCVGSPVSSDALWDIGQYAKITALLLFL